MQLEPAHHLPSFVVHKSSLQPHGFLLPTRLHNQTNQTLATQPQINLHNSESRIQQKDTIVNLNSASGKSSSQTSFICVSNEINDNNNVNHKGTESDLFTFKGSGSSFSPINISDEEEFVKSDDVMDLLEEKSRQNLPLID